MIEDYQAVVGMGGLEVLCYSRGRLVERLKDVGKELGRVSELRLMWILEGELRGSSHLHCPASFSLFLVDLHTQLLTLNDISIDPSSHLDPGISHYQHAQGFV